MTTHIHRQYAAGHKEKEPSLAPAHRHHAQWQEHTRSIKAHGMDIFQALGNNRFPKKDHLKGMQVRVHKKLELLASHEIMEVLGSHLDALDALNTPASGSTR